MDEQRDRGGELVRFTELAGNRLYRNNAFAVTGLPADAAGRSVRQQRQRLDARLAVQKSWPGDPESPLTVEYRVEEVRIAFDQFQDARRRLVDELMWRWGDADLGCDCPGDLHATHDAAVLAHAEALEGATAPTGLADARARELWAAAADGWAATLAHPSFRAHVGHRVDALAEDRRLAALTADDFVDKLPALLVSPLNELAGFLETRAELAEICARFNRHAVFAPLVAEGFERIVDEGSRAINATLRAAEEDRREGRFSDALDKLRVQVKPAYEELEPYWPFVSDWRREELSHLVAVGMNNLAVALLEHHRYQRASAQRSGYLIELAESALRITPTDQGGTIAENLRVIRQLHGHAARRRTNLAGADTAAGATPQEGTLWGCLAFLVILLGIIGVIVAGVSSGFVPALLTGLGTLTALGLIGTFSEAGRARREAARQQAAGHQGGNG
ncbi:hypothetical protein SAMN06297387_115122 [Streptomyces zhaozhouensis]|uniref:Uncharacterized protein n=1 Tax=Streptomyces zhaozhouensis TaxID=1300267 RepID=A0A286E032_9ACTN|nr:hypothetical protein [Streptomyces zhaozhouensis]SOD64262.1 hypothetical protein SAMN06297387_115122 [Streptomyces zhaozhouensis]